MTARPATRWAVIIAAFGAGIIGAAHIGKVPAALPAIRADIGLGLVAAGWVVSVFSATGMALGMVAGLASDRLGHRRMLVAGALILAAGSTLGAYAETGWGLLATRFLEGLGFLVTVVSAPSVISEASSEGGRRLSVGIWGSFMPTGLGGMMVLSPILIAAWGWRGSWLALAAVTLAWALAMGLTFWGESGRGAGGGKTGGDRRPEPVWRNLSLTLRARGPWLLALCFSFYTLAWLAMTVWLPTFLVEERGLPIATAAWLTVAVVLVNLPGNLAGGWLLHKGAPRAAVIGAAALVIGIAGPLVFLDLLPDGWRYGLCLVYSGAVGLLPAGVLGGAPYFAPSPRQIGSTNGLIVQGSHLGQFLGPPVVAAAVALTGGWQAGALVFAVCGAGALGFAILIGLEERRLVRAQGSSDSSTP